MICSVSVLQGTFLSDLILAFLCGPCAHVQEGQVCLWFYLYVYCVCMCVCVCLRVCMCYVSVCVVWYVYLRVAVCEERSKGEL